LTSVAPGSGWPGDPADRSTPLATDAAGVGRLAASSASIVELDGRVSVCRACPRLVEWREDVARVKRAAFADQQYWGRPVPGWGPDDARIAVVGLAPAAHGANRTGRMFTGDRSGDWLYGSLHRCGLAELPTSSYAGDGQRLIDVRIVAAVRCAPPQNSPSTDERDRCRPWLERELTLLAPSLRVVVALGGFAWATVWPLLRRLGYELPQRRVPFGHLVEVRAGEVLVLGSYHPSQQNTFTGKLTEPMLDAVFRRADAYAKGG
jgi:uracil-DNA glycosylase